MPVVVEDWNVTGRKRQVKGEVDYTLNGAKTYFRSRTKVYADWNSSEGRMNLDGTAKDLMVRPWKRSVSEDFQLSHTTQDGHIWRLFSASGYTWLPGQLLTLDESLQVLNLGMLSSQNYASWQHRLGRWRITGKAGLDVQRQQINEHDWSMLFPYAEPAVQREIGSHTFDGILRVGYQRRQYDGNTRQRVTFEPTLRWNWEISPKSSFMAYYRLSVNPVQGLRVVDEPVYTSYRSLYVGIGSPDVQSSHTLYGTFSSRNPVSGLFFSVSPMWTLSKGNLLCASEMISGLYLQRATGQMYDTDLYSVNGRVSKSFSWARTVVGLSGSASLGDYSYLSGGEVVDARTAEYAASADYSLRPARWMSVQGYSGVIVSRRSVEGLAPTCISDWEHWLQLNFLPAKGWMLSWRNELYHSSEKDFGVNWFSDLSVSYKADRWEILLIGSNIVGTSQYERVRVSSTVQSYTLTHLRPREVLLKVCWDL